MALRGHEGKEDVRKRNKSLMNLPKYFFLLKHQFLQIIIIPFSVSYYSKIHQIQKSESLISLKRKNELKKLNISTQSSEDKTKNVYVLPEPKIERREDFHPNHRYETDNLRGGVYAKMISSLQPNNNTWERKFVTDDEPMLQDIRDVLPQDPFGTRYKDGSSKMEILNGPMVLKGIYMEPRGEYPDSESDERGKKLYYNLQEINDSTEDDGYLDEDQIFSSKVFKNQIMPFIIPTSGMKALPFGNYHISFVIYVHVRQRLE